MSDKITYKLHSGKPIKALWFARKAFGMIIPDFLYEKRRKHVLAVAKNRSDYNEISRRVDYYCRLNNKWSIQKENEIKRSRSWLLYTGTLGGYTRKIFHTAYFFDQHDVTRWFPKKLRWSFCPGDVYFTPKKPTIVKSRLINTNNINSVVLKLDKLRHFMFVNDKKQFREKKDRAIFRGKIRQSRLRTAFLEKFFNTPICDCGVVGRNEGCPNEWMMPKKTIAEHLDYKFIIALEGNDVASNLKWVMSSNSIAVMPRPTCETWFMEGTLRGDYHYIEVKEDFSDLEEKLSYYINHPEKAQEIIDHAHEYIRQFQDEKREEIIQIMVMDKYLRLSGQKF